MVGVVEVECCGEGVKEVAILVTPMGELLSVVVTTGIEVHLGGSWLWVVVHIEGILNSVNEDFCWCPPKAVEVGTLSEFS
jgi:hypothetical protein